MCLSFCQTQTGFVVKAEVVRWRKARLPGHPREIEIKVFLSRYWTLAGDNSEEQGSLEARIDICQRREIPGAAEQDIFGSWLTAPWTPRSSSSPLL